MQIWALVKYNAHPAKESQLNTNVPFSLGQAQAQTLARDPVTEYASAPTPAATPTPTLAVPAGNLVSR